MAEIDNYEAQAQYWNNYYLIDRSVKACVHLEDKDDEMFWDGMLQKYSPGKYHYISYSNSRNGKPTTGCEQCLRFAPYLSDKFFVCIDSDYRHLLGQPDIDAAHHILQTYTYSWENHYCERNNLNARIGETIAKDKFDFTKFLHDYSVAVYEPLLLLLHSRKQNDGEMRDKEFNQCLINQCTGKDLENDGAGIISKIRGNLTILIAAHKAYVDSIDLASLKSEYATKGLTEDTAYLHVRGHNLFDLVAYIGKLLCQKLRVDFKKAILAHAMPSNSYWEMDKLVKDMEML